VTFSGLIGSGPRLPSLLCLCLAAGGISRMDAAHASTALQPVPPAKVGPQPIRLPILDGTDIRFTRPSTARELLQTNVYHILQDNQGFMWFATRSGLYRYDGYNFKVFAPDPGDPNSLSDVEINTVFKDRGGAIWVGCAQFLNKLDSATETFMHYPIPSVDQMSQDSAGILWLATPTAGLYSLDPATGQIRHYSSDPHDPSSLSSNHVTYTGEDKEGRFWIANTACLEEFDRGTGTVKRHTPLPEAPFGFGFYEDRFKILWIFHVSPFVLTTFDRETNTLTHYGFPEWKPDGNGVTRVTAILEDRSGDLWMATHGAGLLKYDRGHQRFIRYGNDPADADSLPQNDLDALFEDRDGGIWVGLGRMGVVRFATKPLPFKRLPHAPGSRVNPFVGAIYEDRQRVLWVGTPEALDRIERTTGRRTSYRNGGPTTDTDAIALCEDHSGNLWVGTFGHGLLRFDRRTGQFKTYRHNPADPHTLSDDIVSRLLVDHSGTLWAGTESGLSRFDAVTQRFTTYNLGTQDRSLAYLELVEDRGGALWLGTHSSGLQRFDPATGEFKTYEHDANHAGTLSDNRVNSLLFDRTGTMWVGTQNGLDKLDPKTGKFILYTRRDGLPGNSVGCILDDDRGTLWMSTNNGVARFDPQRRIFSIYSTADGLPGPNLTGWGACFKSPSGEMFFGGFSGATAFFPDQVVDSSYTPPIVLTDFRLSGNPVKIGSRSPLHRSISYVRGLVLSHQQNIFSLTFAALSYANSETNRYRYRLEGLERDWNEVGGDRRQAAYTTLPAGRYTFHVQGATSHGPWSEPGLSLPIEILPPLWGTSWFIGASTLFVLVSIWLLYRVHLGQIAGRLNLGFEERLRERTRIAQDLHDTLLQNITGLSLQINGLWKVVTAPESVRDRLQELRQQAQACIHEARQAVWDLRSLESQSVDLAVALRESGERLTAGRWAHFSFCVEGDPTPIALDFREQLLRIAREAISNATHHSQAKQIEVRLGFERTSIRLQITDDGRGFNLDEASALPGHFGLTTMRERADQIRASLVISSQVGCGTCVEITVPSSH
jgi:ligand-binding sensor domain-containing protein/two-component sensor histidine kinase